MSNKFFDLLNKAIGVEDETDEKDSSDSNNATHAHSDTSEDDV